MHIAESHSTLSACANEIELETCSKLKRVFEFTCTSNRLNRTIIDQYRTSLQRDVQQLSTLHVAYRQTMTALHR